MTETTRIRPGGLDRTSPMPLWAQLLEDIERRVDSGEFADTFPSELSLCGQYAVSRHTVREALRRLRQDGIVIAERGRPPRLATAAGIEQPLGALYSLFASVESAGMEQRSVVRVLDVRADAVAADHLGLEGSVPLVHLERLRLADDEPLAVDRAWLPAAIAEPLLHADFRHTGLYDELATRCNIRVSGGFEHLRAIVPTDAERALLDIDAGVAAFAVDRTGCSSTRPVEWRTSIVRGDRFTVTAEFSTRTGYQLGLGRT